MPLEYYESKQLIDMGIIRIYDYCKRRKIDNNITGFYYRFLGSEKLTKFYRAVNKDGVKLYTFDLKHAKNFTNK